MAPAEGKNEKFALLFRVFGCHGHVPVAMPMCVLVGAFGHAHEYMSMAPAEGKNE